MKINPKNERVKRTYRIYLKEARQLDEQSIDAIDKAMDRFETYTKRRDFRDYRKRSRPLRSSGIWPSRTTYGLARG